MVNVSSLQSSKAVEGESTLLRDLPQLPHDEVDGMVSQSASMKYLSDRNMETLEAYPITTEDNTHNQLPTVISEHDNNQQNISSSYKITFNQNNMQVNNPGNFPLMPSNNNLFPSQQVPYDHQSVGNQPTHVNIEKGTNTGVSEQEYELEMSSLPTENTPGVSQLEDEKMKEFITYVKGLSKEKKETVIQHIRHILKDSNEESQSPTVLHQEEENINPLCLTLK